MTTKRSGPPCQGPAPRVTGSQTSTNIEDTAAEWSESWLRMSLSRYLPPLSDTQWQLIEATVELRAEERRVKQVAVDISGYDWSAASRRPSHATLEFRRSQPGPMLRTFDAEAAARWVETGSSAVTR